MIDRERKGQAMDKIIELADIMDGLAQDLQGLNTAIVSVTDKDKGSGALLAAVANSMNCRLEAAARILEDLRAMEE